jgi:cell division protein FtsL
MEPVRNAPPKTARWGPYRTYFCSVLLFVLGLLVYVWCHVETLAQGERLAELRKTRDELVNEQNVLKAEIVGLQRSSRIRQLAGVQLGMRFPEESPNNLYVAAPGSPATDRSKPRAH